MAYFLTYLYPWLNESINEIPAAQTQSAFHCNIAHESIFAFWVALFFASAFKPILFYDRRPSFIAYNADILLVAFINIIFGQF